MTFDQAFDRAATVAKAVTVEAAPRTWGQRLRIAARDRWAPTPAERIVITEKAKDYIEASLQAGQGLPAKALLTSYLQTSGVGFGPLTWLWIAVMVAKLLAALKHLLNERGETSGVE